MKNIRQNASKTMNAYDTHHANTFERFDRIISEGTIILTRPDRVFCVRLEEEFSLIEHTPGMKTTMTVKVHGAAKIINATPEVKAEVTVWKWNVQFMTKTPSVRWARLCSTRAAPWNWCLVEFEAAHADLKQLLSAGVTATPSTATSSSQPMAPQYAGHSQ